MRLEVFSRRAIQTVIEIKRKRFQIPETGRKKHLNIVAARDTAIDPLGLYPVLDEIIHNETFETIECSGFKRVIHYSSSILDEIR